MAFERIQDRAQGRWRSLLPLIGVDIRFLNGKHGPCPICNKGKDRFRFDDRGGNGTWICSHCGAGSGVDLVMKIKGVDFSGAKREIERHIGESQIIVPKLNKSEAEREERARDQMAALWARGQRLDGSDIASRYLIKRGIELDEWPASLRWIGDLDYWKEKERFQFPAMMAKFVAADNSRAIMHKTYLSEPGEKAKVDDAKKLSPGKVPAGGAVRLFPFDDTLGIAEGIETALSAFILFKIPTWACLTAGAMVKWVPPKAAKTIYIFGDLDKKFAGQHAAYSLAYRLANEGLDIEVRFPDKTGDDWNDFLKENGG